MESQRQHFEAVHNIWDYFDQPRTGVADYHGERHWFECIFDEKKDLYSDVYWLTPMDEYLSEIERQCSEIVEGWRGRFDQGLADQSSHPAVHDETFARLRKELNDGLARCITQRFRVFGCFKLAHPRYYSTRLSEFTVAWAEVENREKPGTDG